MMMKVAVATNGTDLDSDVHPRLGRCQVFIIVDTESMNFSPFPNEGFYLSKNAGVKAAQAMIDRGVEAVVAGFIGHKAYKVFNDAKIKMYLGSLGTVRETINAVKCGRLKDVDDLNTRNRFDMRIDRWRKG